MLLNLKKLNCTLHIVDMHSLPHHNFHLWLLLTVKMEMLIQDCADELTAHNEVKESAIESHYMVYVRAPLLEIMMSIMNRTA